MKIIYMGTPDFSVTILESLINAGHEITTVITQPDRPKGRGKKLQAPPVAVYAKENNISLMQPLSIRTSEIEEFFLEQKPDVVIVAAYGRIIPEALLQIPKYGFINVHASLLPKYRGAAPIQWALRNGDKTTGVSIMQLEKGLDEGPVYCMEELDIQHNWNKKDLFDALALLGCTLLNKTLEALSSSEIVPKAQEHVNATYAPMFEKSDAKADFNLPALALYNLNRSLLPDDAIYTFFNEKRITLRKTEAVPSCDFTQYENGTIVDVTKEKISVKTSDGILNIYEIQPAGKKTMSIKEFKNGNPISIGDSFQS